MNVARWLFPCALLFVLASQPSTVAQSRPSLCVHGISSNPLVMENLCDDPAPARDVPAVTKVSTSQPAALLTLTAQQLSRIQLDDPPTIQPGDVMVFESNRQDFVLHTEASNGKEIVVGPLTLREAEDTSVAWRKGRVRLDYPSVVGQKIVRYRVQVLHETGTPLLFRGVKIYRAGTMMLELEPASPTPKRNPAPQFEPPLRYPSDPVLVASLHQPPLSLRGPVGASTGFVRTTLPPMQPMMAQSTTTTSTDPNHFKWNSKEFDAESGLLNFGARYYSSALGRFMTPDPKIMSAQRMFDPQQWNMYSYGRNNPTTFIDPDGKELQYANAADKKALHNVLVNIARRPGGLSMLKTLSDSKAIFTLHKTDKGELGGTGYYGLTAPAGQVTYDHATGKDLQGTIEIKVDLDQRKADQDMAQAGVLDPKKVPPSDEQTMGHELTHGERIAENPKQYLATPEAERERDADENANNVLKEKPGDKKEAEKQLDHLIKDPKDPKR